jgi:microcystin-dependent protein
MAGANKRVTELAVLSTPTNNDVLPIVDVLDSTQDPTGSLKQITWASLKTAILGLFSAGTGIIFAAGVISSDPTATQTFTNKTLTSPVINSPTITSAALSGTTTLAVGSDATGDIYYRNSGGAVARLGIGSIGQYLGVTAGLPAWGTPGIPSGTISMFGGASAPANWLLCDGTAVSRTTYASLFTAVSTTYGVGDGSTTFNVPNFKGKAPVGYDVAETEFNALAKTGGEKTHTLVVGEIPSHTHGVIANTTSSAGSAGFTPGPSATPATITTDNGTGGNGAHNNLQPYLTVNFIIAI